MLSSHFWCPRRRVSCLLGKKCVSMFFSTPADDPRTARVSFLLLLIATHILSYNQLFSTNYIQFSELPWEISIKMCHHKYPFSANSHMAKIAKQSFRGRHERRKNIIFVSASAARPAVIIINNTFASASGENVNCFQRFASRARSLCIPAEHECNLQWEHCLITLWHLRD